MNDNPDLEALTEYLTRSTRLNRDEAYRVILEMTAFFSETVDDYVIRRHREMKQREGLSNEAIYSRLLDELSQRTFAAPSLSKRQIRRIIYG